MQGTQQFSLLTPHPSVTDLLLVPSAKWSLTGTADDNFLPKPLMPKDGFIGENILQSEFFFSSEQQRKTWVFSVISLLTPQTPEHAVEAPHGPGSPQSLWYLLEHSLSALPVGHTKGTNAEKTAAFLSPLALPRKAPNHRLPSTKQFVLVVSWITALMEAIHTRAGQGLQP